MNETPPATAAPIPNVLAERYASPAMRDIWSQHGRVLLERDFWIAVMKAQRDLGVPIPAEAIKDYEKVRTQVDLAAIAKRERVTLHDVKARIEEFSDLAKRQFIHLGLTSRDLTENVEQLQVFRALKLFSRLGLVERTSSQSPRGRFEEGGKAHHDHMTCLRCGTVLEFHRPEIERLQREEARRRGFQLVRHALELVGYCRSCRKGSRA